MNAGSNQETRRPDRLASYYTPSDVAGWLTDWAITHKQDRLLDPSFGGCAFLYAACETMKQLGNDKPGRNVYGVDIDPSIHPYLDPLFSSNANEEQFIIDDFFAIKPHKQFNVQFDAVVGNPPYVRHHWISDESAQQVKSRLQEYGIQISGRASYWALFVLYSMKFLRRGGRLAMVLPGAFLQTNYAQQVREAVLGYFDNVSVIQLQERIFADAEEETVFLCASGAAGHNRSLRIISIDSRDELPEVLNATENNKAPLRTSEDKWIRYFTDPSALAIYDELAETSHTIKLGERVKFRIGVVTGNNNYFIVSESEKERMGIPETYLKPIVRRPAQLQGLWIDKEELRQYTENGSENWLIAIPDEYPLSTLPQPVQDYLVYGEEQDVNNARKCRDRTPWYSIKDTYSPPAFMPYMSSRWPRVVVNDSEFTCTNNIIRLMAKDSCGNIDWYRLALGTLSSLTQLSAELVGRSYGGGVLKLEPGEMARLIVPLVPAAWVSKVSRGVDMRLRKADLKGATEIVDDVLLRTIPKLSTADLEQIRTARDKLYSRRMRNKNKPVTPY